MVLLLHLCEILWKYLAIAENGNFGVDYMKETSSVLSCLGVPKMSQVSKYFIHCVKKKCTRSVNELKANEKKLISLNSEG